MAGECDHRGVIDDPERCYRAVSSRDSRFDGVFFVGVTSTGIYCRPSCPAVTPKRANVRFYATAAAAQAAGFRACRRCRPDATPGSPEWDQRADLVGRAMRLIADGVVDREGVAGLADRLGYSERHVNRQLSVEVGAGPIALARAQRSQTARLLIETTDLSFADVAFASGFSSIRQFNDTVRAVYARTPTELRRRRVRTNVSTPGAIVVRLAVRSPFDGAGLVDFLAARAVPGVEEVVGTTYRRTLGLAHGHGTVTLSPAASHVDATLRLDDLRDLAAAVAPMPPPARPRRRPPGRGRAPRRRPAAGPSSPGRSRVGGCPEPPTASSWPCGRSSDSRSRWPAPALSPAGS